MEDFFTEQPFEEKQAKKRKSKGFSSRVEDLSLEGVNEIEEEVEKAVEEQIEESPIEMSLTPVKHHDHSIRPMRRTKPVPKRGEKAATQVRR